MNHDVKQDVKQNVKPDMKKEFRPVIGIVGGVGSGKSAVARAFGRRGCVVATSDEMARAVLRDADVRRELAALVGPAAIAPDGTVDRGLVARAIFTSEPVRRGVERIMHPKIEAMRHALFAAAPEHAPGFVIDAPLLLEVGLDRECDAIVFVDAPEAMRRARVMESRGWSADELARREAAQLPLAEKRARASDVVVNDADEERLAALVAPLLERIIARGRRAVVRIAPT